MSFVPSFPPQIPVGMIAPHSTAGTHPADAPQPLQQGISSPEKASAAPSSISETVTGERRSSLIDQVLGQGGSTTVGGQRRGSILDSIQAGAENLYNKAAKFIDDAQAPSTTQTTQTTTSPSGVTTTTTTTTTVVKTTSTDPTATATANGQSITDKISSTFSSLQANAQQALNNNNNTSSSITTTASGNGNIVTEKFNELKINAQAAYQNREAMANAVDREITQQEENFSPRGTEVGKKMESGARNAEVKATGFLDQVTAAVQEFGQAVDRRTSVSGNPGLLTRVSQGAEALRRSADGILDSGTLGAGGAGGLAAPIKRLSVSQPSAPAAASTTPVADSNPNHIATTAPGPPVTSNANAMASGSGIVPSHPEVVEAGSGEKAVTTTTNEVPHSGVA